MKGTYVSETSGVWSACSETDLKPMHSNAELERSTRSRNSESYKNDVEERLKATVDRMRSTSFDDTTSLPPIVPNAILSEVLQCCFKKKRNFFRRTGKIMKLQICLTNKDTLIIYKASDEGLILSLSCVKKTSVTTQTIRMNNGRIMLVCRYRIVFDFGTLNLFLINDSIRRWRVALDEIIDRYSQLHYEQIEESCLVTAKRSFVSRCQETQPSSIQDVSAVRSESPTILTLETSPTGRTFTKSPCTKSSVSSRDRTSREPVQSVRQGKRSVASLRARIQRKICRSTFGASKHKRNSETSKACQVSENDLLRFPQVPQMRRHQSDRMDVEPLVTISETSTSSAPPLPTNPPPSLSSSDNHYTPTSVKLRELPQSPYREVSIRTALSSYSYKKLATSEFLESLCATPVPAERAEDLHTAVSEISVFSEGSFKNQRLSVSLELNSSMMQQIPVKLESTKRSSVANAEVPRIKPRTLLGLRAADQKTPNKIISQSVKATFSRDTPEEVFPAPALNPFIVYPRSDCNNAAASAVESEKPLRPPRRREAVPFSISPDPSQSEVETESYTNKIEELVPNITFEECSKDCLHGHTV